MSEVRPRKRQTVTADDKTLAALDGVLAQEYERRTGRQATRPDALALAVKLAVEFLEDQHSTGKSTTENPDLLMADQGLSNQRC